MRKITFCLGLMLSAVFSLGANAAAGDPVMLESGKYTIRNSANSGYCFSNGAQIIRNAPQTLLDAYAFTVTYVESKEAYTIQDFNGKYLTNSNNNIVVQETCDEDNSYWRIVENYGPGTGYDIISLTLDNAAGSKSWNFAGDYNKKGANSLLGTWEADDKDSVWAFTKYEKDNSHLDKSNWTVTASSACIDSGENGPIDNILDEDVTTYWHSNWRTAGTDNAYGIGNTMPQWFIIDLGKEETFSQFSYSRRYNGYNGICSQYKLYVQSEPFAPNSARPKGARPTSRPRYRHWREPFPKVLSASQTYSTTKRKYSFPNPSRAAMSCSCSRKPPETSEAAPNSTCSMSVPKKCCHRQNSVSPTCLRP